MRKYDIILLDADETLFDFKRSEKEALKNTFSDFNFTYTEDISERYSKINKGYWKLFEKGEIDKPSLAVGRFQSLLEELNLKGSAEKLNGRYMEHLSNGRYLLDGAAHFCRELSMRYILYIITNGTAQIQKSRFSGSGLECFIQKVYISDEIGYQKPRREYFDFVLSDIGARDKSRVLVLGDSLSSDIQGGINAGLDTCWLCSDNSLETDLKYTYKINSFCEFFEKVEDE